VVQRGRSGEMPSRARRPRLWIFARRRVPRTRHARPGSGRPLEITHGRSSLAPFWRSATRVRPRVFYFCYFSVSVPLSNALISASRRFCSGERGKGIAAAAVAVASINRLMASPCSGPMVPSLTAASAA
jgi:hypothetical protein